MTSIPVYSKQELRVRAPAIFLRAPPGGTLTCALSRTHRGACVSPTHAVSLMPISLHKPANSVSSLSRKPRTSLTCTLEVPHTRGIGTSYNPQPLLAQTRTVAGPPAVLQPHHSFSVGTASLPVSLSVLHVSASPPAAVRGVSVCWQRCRVSFPSADRSSWPVAGPPSVWLQPRRCSCERSARACRAVCLCTCAAATSPCLDCVFLSVRPCGSPGVKLAPTHPPLPDSLGERRGMDAPRPKARWISSPQPPGSSVDNPYPLLVGAHTTPW